MPEPLREYVILRHALAIGQHWDLMLDTGEALATWQLTSDPAILAAPDSTVAISARRIVDHRRAYLDYEGPVSRQRGFVTRVDKGCYEVVAQRSGEWSVRLDGVLLRGVFRLAGVAPDAEGTFQRSAG